MQGVLALVGFSSVKSKQSRNVKYSEVKNIAASIIRPGNSRSPARPGLPSRAVTVVTTTTVSTSTDSHIRPNTAKAQKLRRQAIKLKKRLLAGEKSCQYTSAGACQNSSESGMCRPMKTHMAPWNAGSIIISRVGVSPPR